jgi:hypothetical protein
MKEIDYSQYFKLTGSDELEWGDCWQWNSVISQGGILREVAPEEIGHMACAADRFPEKAFYRPYSKSHDHIELNRQRKVAKAILADNNLAASKNWTLDNMIKIIQAAEKIPSPENIPKTLGEVYNEATGNKPLEVVTALEHIKALYAVGNHFVKNHRVQKQLSELKSRMSMMYQTLEDCAETMDKYSRAYLSSYTECDAHRLGSAKAQASQGKALLKRIEQEEKDAEHDRA